MEAGFPGWLQESEIGGNEATLHNVSESKKCKEARENRVAQ